MPLLPWFRLGWRGPGGDGAFHDGAGSVVLDMVGLGFARFCAIKKNDGARAWCSLVGSAGAALVVPGRAWLHLAACGLVLASCPSLVVELGAPVGSAVALQGN